MEPGDTHSTQQLRSRLLLSRGRELARQGARKQAQECFKQVLAAQPGHIDALLWLAALARDARESIRFLNRVLEISPDNPRARAGLEWAQQRQTAIRPSPPTAQRVLRREMPWLDRLLLSGIAVVIVAACAILSFMVWRTPEAVRAAYQPTPIPSATSTFSPSPTPTSTPTVTPTPAWPDMETVTPTSTPVPSPPAASTPFPYPTLGFAAPLRGKWIGIDLSSQRLTAYEGQRAVLSALVSTGVARMPTPLGDYTIYRKVRVQAMGGPDYYLPNVEYVSYFYRGYALHGTYWHDNFGQPMSHGCVNMRNPDAQWIWDWAPVGTLVRVHP